MRFLLSILVMVFGSAVWADEVVSVASLEVRDRIQTMEQINVSAETEVHPEAPTSEAVARLLEEAREIESEGPAKPGSD